MVMMMLSQALKIMLYLIRQIMQNKSLNKTLLVYLHILHFSSIPPRVLHGVSKPMGFDPVGEIPVGWEYQCGPVPETCQEPTIHRLFITFRRGNGGDGRHGRGHDLGMGQGRLGQGTWMKLGSLGRMRAGGLCNRKIDCNA
jgi:hypothetical protein